uniref:Zgc:154006 n=1 Tax=Oryzias latipes TaxID=8090 RepID=A0A3P9HJZ2_ORYLA
MYEPRYYDSPPLYSPPYSATSHSFYPPRSVHSLQSQHAPYRYDLPPNSYCAEGRPQHFYHYFSPPGFVKTFQGATALLCFIIFACVASTLVWDTNGFGYGGFGVGSTSGSVTGVGSGYYGGSYGYGGSYMTPLSAKSAMISVAAINFLVSLGFLVGSFSRSRIMRGCRFYLIIFICDIILAVLQGIIDIIFVIGVNPMSQSSQSMLYNPMLMMCQNIQGSPSLSGSVGAGFPGGFPMYNQYLHHYCYMDPEEAVAFALGLMVVLALSFSAYYAYKTRSKIWRHGKCNIVWDEPGVRPVHSTQRAPTVVISERAASGLRAEDSGFSSGKGTLGVHNEECSKSNSSGAESQHHSSKAAIRSSSSEEEDSFRKPPPYHGNRKKRKDGESMFAPQVMVESEYETGETDNELDRDHTHDLYRLYPAITSDEQRRKYKEEFDSDLAHYKRLCSTMDDIGDRMHKLSRELDLLDEESIKYQVENKKKKIKDLQKKLSHIKCLVKLYDQGFC